MIEELQREGFYITSADKGAGSVKHGIDLMKRYKLKIHRNSSNIEKEIKSYKWKEMNGTQLEEPVKMFDDALDAARYAIYKLKNYYVGGFY